MTRVATAILREPADVADALQETLLDLQVRSDPGGPPIDSYDGRRVPGPMPVHAYLVFDVVELDQGGAVLEVRDFVVR